RDADRAAAQVAVDEGDGGDHVAEFGADQERQVTARVHAGLAQRQTRGGHRELADSRQAPRFGLVEEPTRQARRMSVDHAGAGDDDPRAHPARLNSSVTFCPPKPNEFEMACSTATSRPLCGTKSKPISGSTFSSRAVGGISSFRSESTVATASSEPAAAIVWPIIDFVELTRTRPSPKTARIARASIRSFCWVAVPCALTSPTADGVTPPCASASRIAPAIPSPPGCGAVT